MRKRGWKRCLSALLSAMLVFSSCFVLDAASVKAADPEVLFTVTADKTQVQRGDTVTVSVDMSGNVRGGGVEVLLSFNQTILQCAEENLTYGPVFDELSRGDVCDLTVGKDGVKAVIGRKQEVVVNGNLFTAQFTVKEDAKGDLGFQVSGFLTDVDDATIQLMPSFDMGQVEDMEVYIPVTGITLDRTSLTLARGESRKLTAEVKPADADQTVTWISSNPSVATVSADGTVTAVEKGKAQITAKAGDMTAVCNVSVNVPLESISISAKDGLDTIKKGQTLQLSVNYTPADADGSWTVDWGSSDEKVATVNANGLVTALADGSTTITAKAGGKTATYQVTVQEIKLTSIAIKESTLIHKGESETLSVTYNPANTTDDRTVTWTSSDTSVATVDGSGNVTAVKPGQAKIQAQVGNFTDECLVTVDAPLKAIIPSVESLDMVKRQTAQLSWTLDPEDTTDSRKVTLSSSDPSVATVDQDGTVTAKKAGTATITLSGANNVKATVSVEVKEIPISGISLSAQSKTMEKLESFDLKATIQPTDNTDDDQTITWKSSDSSVLTVTADPQDSTKAVVTATEKGGTAVITATAWNGVKAECTVKVLKHIESIALPKDVQMSRGETKVLPVTVLPEDTDDTPVFQWSSSDPQVASVDKETGMITAKKAGEAEITVTNVSGVEVFAKTTVTVAEKNLTEEMMDSITFEDMDEDLLKNQSLDMNALLTLWSIVKEEGITDDIVVEWSVDDEDVASIDQSGHILGIKEGTVKVTAKITATDGSGKEITCSVSTSVKVKEIALESIAFDKVITEMQTGAVDVLHILYNPDNTTDDRDVTWSSSDESVISVENGKLTAKKAGTATITAKVGDKTVSCTITVKDAPKTDQNATGDNQNTQVNPTAPKTGGFGVEGILLMIGIDVVLLLAVFLEGNRRKRSRR